MDIATNTMNFVREQRAEALSFIRERRVRHAKRGLERDLARVLVVMEGHKSAKLPTGHHYYVLLKRRTLEIIAGYKQLHKSIGGPVPTEDDIYASVPALRELDRLSSGQSIPSPITPIGVGVLVGGFVVTTVVALYHGWYALVTHWIVR